METNPVNVRNRPYNDGNLHQIDAIPRQRSIMIIEQDVVKQIVDGTVAGTQYVGKAECGTTTASAKWQILRITTVGAVNTYEWADGDGEFDNIWDNRAALTYL